MLYSLDSLKALLTSPITRSKWGKDTKEVISIISRIVKSDCSSCAMRRNIKKLKDILNKYNDDILYEPNNRYIVSKDNGRIPCTDCVAKHVSEASILQSEFIQGYTDYMPLIESHISQALKECPSDNIEVRSILQDALNSIVVDNLPYVPEVIYENPKYTEEGAFNSLTFEIYPNSEYNSTYSSLKNIPSRRMGLIYRALTEYNAEYSDIVKNTEHKYDNYGGHMAVAADMIAPYCSYTSNVLRSRRLCIQDCVRSGKTHNIKEVWVSNIDITEYIATFTKMQKNGKK